MRFKQYLTEVIQVADVSFKKDSKKMQGRYEVRIAVENLTYVIAFYQSGLRGGRERGLHDIWSVQFHIDKDTPMQKFRKKIATSDRDRPDFKMQNLNQGVEFKLMPLILGYIKDFLKIHNPDCLKILAAKDEESRVSVYKKLMQRNVSVLTGLGYALDTQDSEHDAILLLIKQELIT